MQLFLKSLFNKIPNSWFLVCSLPWNSWWSYQVWRAKPWTFIPQKCRGYSSSTVSVNCILKNFKEIFCYRTDYYWAKAMGFTGSQMADISGVSVGTNEKPTFEYSYLGGRCRHYKLVVGQYFYLSLSKSYHISRKHL